jgi:CBS domain-containing protein
MSVKTYRFRAFGFNDKIADAIQACKHYGFSHIPIVEKGIFRGMMRCDDLMEYENEEEKLESLRDYIEKIYLSDKMSWTDTLALMIRNEANVLGVLDLSGKFIGIKLLDDLINYLAEKDFVNKNGYILVIRKNTTDFSISEVAQIIESDGGVILGILVNESNGETELEVKIQSEDINEIIQSFRRFDYTILSEMEEDLHLQELKEHSAFLKKYLEIGD